MLYPTITSVNFKANRQEKDYNGKYVDPLMRWPLRAASYTNGAGEVLRPLIGSYAALGWVPVLMYIGADIYDKYKNNENEYSPSSERFLKQAVYQGISTLLLPIVTSRIGQGVFSEFGKLGSSKLGFNTQEKISKLAENYIANGKMQDSALTKEGRVKEFMEIVYNNLDFNKQEAFAKNPVKNILYRIEKLLSKTSKINKKEQIEQYAKQTIEDLISVQNELSNPSEKYKGGKIYGEYIQGLKNGQTESIAKRSALRSYQKSKMMKGKIFKTLGGFLAVVLTIKPADKFIDKIIFGKIINPGMEKIENFDMEDLSLKKLRESFKDKNDD